MASIGTVLGLLALVLALAAFVQARRTAREVARLSEMYWRLKYEHGELKTLVTPPVDPPPVPTTAFVPLGSVKRTST
jgi:hypothetical protein